MIIAAKVGTILLWLGSAALWFAGDGETANTARLVFLCLLGAHVVECVVFRSTLAQAPGGMASNIVQTLVYGFVHVGPLRGGSGDA